MDSSKSDITPITICHVSNCEKSCITSIFPPYLIIIVYLVHLVNGRKLLEKNLESQTLYNYKLTQVTGLFFRVIGAVVIIVGLYLVLWGKSKDQLESTSDSNKVVLTTQNMDTNHTMNERKATSKQEFLAIDVTSTKSTLGTT